MNAIAKLQVAEGSARGGRTMKVRPGDFIQVGSIVMRLVSRVLGPEGPEYYLIWFDRGERYQCVCTEEELDRMVKNDKMN